MARRPTAAFIICASLLFAALICGSLSLLTKEEDLGYLGNDSEEYLDSPSRIPQPLVARDSTPAMFPDRIPNNGVLDFEIVETIS